MSKRKGTPDVLAEILTGAALEDLPPAPANQVKRFPDPTRVQAEKPAKPVSHPVEKPAREKSAGWEYRLVSFQDYKGWRARFINGRELPDWTGGPLIHDYLAEMGKEGWELAAASAGERLYGSGDHHHLYFKRRR